MRGNNKRKLISEPLLIDLLNKYRDGVPLSKLVKNYRMDISTPHLRKLLFIYIDILDPEQSEANQLALRKAIFPAWIEGTRSAIVQPNEWTYKGKFPFGEWKVIQLDCWPLPKEDDR